MLSLTVLVLVVTSAVGVYLAARIWKGKGAPLPHSVAHALVGLVGLMLLAVAAVTGEGSNAMPISVPLLGAATLSGFLLLYYQQKRKSLVLKPAVAVHGCLAVLGIVLLVAL